MQAIKELYEELNAFYGYEQETKMASLICAEWLQTSLAKQRVGPATEVNVGGKKVDPNNPDPKYEYTKTLGKFIDGFARNGSHATIRRRGLIALIYALWEHRSRELIAKECNKTKNCIESDVFQDLNKYRQAILHVGGKLDRKPKAIRFFGKGDVVSLTQNHMEDLFKILIDELNRLGETYYGENPRLSLEKPLFPRAGDPG